MKHTAHNLSTEIRRHKREQFSKWFAIPVGLLGAVCIILATENVASGLDDLANQQALAAIN